MRAWTISPTQILGRQEIAFGRKGTAKIRFVCSDMWQAYLKVIAKKVGQALHILDR